MEKGKIFIAKMEMENRRDAEGRGHKRPKNMVEFFRALKNKIKDTFSCIQKIVFLNENYG